MNFLKDILKEKKWIEADKEIEDFLEQNDISDKAIVYKIELGKERFKTEEEAREYLSSKYYWDYTIEETDTHFIAVAISEEQLKITNMQIQIGREAVGFIADLITVCDCEEIVFNDKGEVRLSSKFGAINLSEGAPHIIEIAKVSKGTHPIYGEVDITQQHLESFESNFNNKVAGVDLAVNEDHSKKEAFGWFKDVFLSFDKQTLLGQINWNTKGTKALSEKEYRYFSPELSFNYTHPHTGEQHGPTLLGGALTNYPFLKMDAITNLNNKNKNGANNMNTIELSVHNEKVVELSTEINGLKVSVDSEKAKNVELSAKITALETEKKDTAKKAAHQKLFDTQKITAAQLVALNDGKSFLEVLSLNEKTNPKAKGANPNPSEEVVVDLNEGEIKVAEQLGLTPEEYQAVEL